jgi:hypothetical protein
MATRFSNAHKNLIRHEVDWDIEIIDELGSPVGTFRIPGRDGVTFRWDGPAQDILPGIYSCYVTFNFEIKDATYEQMMTDIRDKDRSRFAVRVLREGVLKFVGRFTAHNLVIENAPMPYNASLTAECGLASLKNYDYEPGSGVLFMDHIKACMDLLDIQDYYTGDFFAINCDWYHNDMPNATDNPLSMASVANNAFRKGFAADSTYTQLSESDYITAWDVLNAIARVWGLHITYMDGMFVAYQASQMAASSHYRWVYDKDFVETASSGTFSIETTLDFSAGRWTLAGGSFGALDALKSVTVPVVFDTGNLAKGQEWDKTDETERTIGGVRINSVADRLNVGGTLEYQTVPLNTSIPEEDWLNHRYMIDVQIRAVNEDTATTYYLKREVSIATSPSQDFNSPDFDVPTWETGGAEVINQPSNIYYWGLSIAAGNTESLIVNTTPGPSGTFAPNFSIKSPPLTDIGSLGDTITIYMTVSLNTVLAVDGDDLTSPGPPTDPYTTNWWLRNADVHISNTTSAEATTYMEYNTFTNDTDGERRLTFEVLFSDIPNKENGIKIWNGGLASYSTKEWAIGALGGSDGIAMLLAKELLRLRAKTKKSYIGGVITEDFNRGSRFSMFSDWYFPMRGTYKTGKDLWSGTMIEVVEDDISGGTDSTEEVLGYPTQTQTDAPPPPDAPPGMTPAPNGLITDEPIDTVTSYTSIDVQNNSGLELDSGTWVSVTNLITGVSELVQLTASLTAAGTSISISSNVFSSAFPVGSVLGVAPVEEFKWVEELFTITSTDVSNGYVTVTGPLNDPAVLASDRHCFNHCRVIRGSSELVFTSSATSLMGSIFYGIDKANERITFPDDWPLIAGENVVIRYIIPIS